MPKKALQMLQFVVLTAARQKDRTLDRTDRCSQSLVPNVASRIRFLLNQKAIDQFFVRTVLCLIKVQKAELPHGKKKPKNLLRKLKSLSLSN